MSDQLFQRVGIPKHINYSDAQIKATELEKEITSRFIVEGRGLGHCGGAGPGSLWRGGAWVTVEGWGLGHCGGVGPGSLWRGGAWVTVEGWGLGHCGGVGPGSLWRGGAWITVEGRGLGHCGGVILWKIVY